MEPLHFHNSIKNNICHKFQMVERRNINKITDKYSSRNVPVPTQILNIKVLSPAHQKMAHKYRRNLFSQFLNHRHQPLQFRFLNRLFLLIRFLLESQVLHHNLLRRLSAHLICDNFKNERPMFLAYDYPEQSLDLLLAIRRNNENYFISNHYLGSEAPSNP